MKASMWLLIAASLMFMTMGHQVGAQRLDLIVGFLGWVITGVAAVVLYLRIRRSKTVPATIIWLLTASVIFIQLFPPVSVLLLVVACVMWFRRSRPLPPSQ